MGIQNVGEFQQILWQINQTGKREIDPVFEFDVSNFMVQFMMDQKIPYPGITERFFYYMMQFSGGAANKLYVLEDFINLITETCGKGKL